MDHRDKVRKDNEAERHLFELWCALFEEDPNEDASYEKFLTVKDQFPTITLSAEEFDKLQAELDQPPKELPRLRQMLQERDES